MHVKIGSETYSSPSLASKQQKKNRILDGKEEEMHVNVRSIFPEIQTTKNIQNWYLWEREGEGKRERERENQEKEGGGDRW